MSAFPSAVQTSLGRIFHLAKQIGKGGEGAIYEAKEQNDIALKLYWPNKAQSRREKVSAMASAQLYKNSSFVAFPMDVLFSPSGAFVGFAMKKVGGHKPVHMLYSPASRKLEFHRANFPFLIRSAGNISRAVASVHTTGCVIGDVNHSGFLVSDKATSIVIDSDSFQVVAGSNSFLCQVGTPEYTPPELQGSRFDRTRRTPNHDNFGLAILVFQLLFMGRHPFSGKFLGSGEMPLERSISEYRFAYSMQSSTKMERPPGAPILSDFPPYIGQAFEIAFGRPGSNARPNASEWISLLEKLEGELERCAADSSHHHVKGKPCPWCRMEQTNPGFVAFTTAEPAIYIPTSIDIAQLSAIINAIQDPGPTLGLQAVISKPTNLNAVAPSGALNSKLKHRAYGGVAASAAGAILIFLGGDATLPGLVILGAGLLCNIIIPPELKKLREARSQANISWRIVENAWPQQPGNKKYLEIKKEANDFVRALADLPNEESRGLQILEQKKRDSQLNRHLDRFLIAHAKIKKIGSGRKAILASFGIETAADIDRHKVSSIQGFGPSLVSELVAWRQIQINKFVFNPSEPISQNDLAALKIKIANRKTDLENKVRASAINLKQASNSALEQRKKLTSSANQAFLTLKEAELNEAAATGPVHKASKFISLCCAGLAAVGLLLGTQPDKKTAATHRSVADTVEPVQPLPPLKAKPPELARPNPQIPYQPAPEPFKYTRPNLPSEPKLPQTPLAKLPGLSISASTVLPPTRSPPLPPAQDIPSIPSGGSSLGNLDLSRSEDATRVQQRLISLGYLAGSADGKWGAKSKAALLIFRSQAGLPKNEAWDDLAQQALFSANAESYQPPQSFVGSWSPEKDQCGEPGEPPPLRITAKRAESDTGAACEFNSVKPDGQDAWRIVAACSASGRSWTANIRLAVSGTELIWSSEQPKTVYYRCRASP